MKVKSSLLFCYPHMIHAVSFTSYDECVCSELYCSVLESPRWGYVSPSTCTKKYQNIPVGSVCKYECAKGYEISKQTKSTTLSCRIDGTWNHASASCHREESFCNYLFYIISNHIFMYVLNFFFSC